MILPGFLYWLSSKLRDATSGKGDLQVGLPAGARIPHVEMEVVGMGRVVVRPEGDRENPAGALVDALQEFAFLAAIGLMGFDIDQAAVL